MSQSLFFFVEGVWNTSTYGQNQRLVRRSRLFPNKISPALCYIKPELHWFLLVEISARSPQDRKAPRQKAVAAFGVPEGFLGPLLPGKEEVLSGRENQNWPWIVWGERKCHLKRESLLDSLATRDVHSPAKRSQEKKKEIWGQLNMRASPSPS